SLIDVPLHLSEIEALAVSQGRPLLKDRHKTEHFIHRVLSTVRMYKAQIQQMHRDIQEMQLQRERAGAPTTLSPMDSVRYLSDAQLEQVFGKVARQQLARLRQAQAEAARVAATAREDNARIRRVL